MLKKPDSVTIKEWTIKLVADELQVDESIAETVISDAYREANKAVKVHNQIELSGFGKFLVSQSKVRRKIARYEKYIAKLASQIEGESDPLKIEKLKYKINYSNNILEELYRRQQL